jgi:hypothetical protein
MKARSQYQERDKEVVDYQLYELPGVSVQVRGPRVELRTGEYVACLGAAQTFGTLCTNPWPTLLREEGIEVLNLGFGGAGPSFFLLNPRLIELANKAAIAVVQVTSARSTRNGYLELAGGRSEARPRGSTERYVAAELVYERILQTVGPRVTQMLVEESRRNWILEMELLLEALKVPTVLFWFSERVPQYVESYKRVRDFMGQFPQLVNECMMDNIRSRATSYVQCVTSRGMPQALKHRITGEPVMVALGNNKQLRSHNAYYPSPEMHEDAATALRPVLMRLLNASKSKAPSHSERAAISVARPRPGN